ncbi:MAG: thioredoxin domain-containing protein [Myxococcota bacterium]|nr:thioredoxin domain-containing protein [Myxococcota bacterium]
MRCRPGLALAPFALLAAAAAADPLPGAAPFPPALAARIEAALAARGPDYEPRTHQRLPDGRPRYTNRLILETSPYLEQHAHNPVDWYAWGDEAFARARAENRPVFVSIGYSTCHWCHVMEEESFDSPVTAALLNRYYVAIKVDREERPDVDGVYMTAVRVLTGSGGWPLNVFLTPDGRPFYGGTYFPPADDPRSGRPGFRTVLDRVRDAYAVERERIDDNTRRLVAAMRAELRPAPAVGLPGAGEIDAAFASYRERFDPEHGGLRGRTRFPSSLPIPFLLRHHRRSGDPEPLRMAERTLDAMARGGIYDHVGGGFHRYTTEPTWTVPHFEKMLYDNALLARAYTEAWQASGDSRWRERARDVLDYLAREMTSEHGTWYAASDADSEGEEGSYFVWTPAQVRAAVGDELAPLALTAYGVTERGNFEGGRTVLRRDRPPEALAAERGRPVDAVREDLARIRARLAAARSERVPPLTDHKQIVAWNGLAISAHAQAGLAFGEREPVERARVAAAALLARARPDGRLARYLHEGRPHGAGLLDDHAFLIAGLLDLFEATGEPRWLEAALSLQADLDRRFFDDTAGGYFTVPSDGERLLVREKPSHDGAVPSGNSVAALNALRLQLLTGDAAIGERAEMTVRALSGVLERAPTALPRLHDAVDFLLDEPVELLVVTPRSRAEAEPFLRALGPSFVPNRSLVVVAEAELPALARHVPSLRHKRAIGGTPTAYVCRNRVCDAPTADPAEFARQARRRTVPASPAAPRATPQG